MEPFAGTLGAFLVSMLCLHSAKMVGLGTVIAGYPIWKVALVIHIAAWILQFIGHGVFEGNFKHEKKPVKFKLRKIQHFSCCIET